MLAELLYMHGGMTINVVWLTTHKKNWVEFIHKEPHSTHFLAVYNILENIRGYCCTALLASLFPFWKRKSEKKGWKECFLWLVGECTFYSHCCQRIWKSNRHHRYHQKYEKSYMNSRAKCKTDHVTLSCTIPKPSLVPYTSLMHISLGGIFTASKSEIHSIPKFYVKWCSIYDENMTCVKSWFSRIFQTICSHSGKRKLKMN